MAISISTPNPHPHLSPNDTLILHALFDPETLPSSLSKSKDSAINPSLPSHPSISASALSALEKRQNELVRRINGAEERVKNSKNQRESAIEEIEVVLKELDEVLEQNPEYGSA